MRLTIVADHVHNDRHFTQGDSFEADCLGIRGDNIDQVWLFRLDSHEEVTLPTHVFALAGAEFNKDAMDSLCKEFPYLEAKRHLGLRRLFNSFVVGLPIMERAYTEELMKAAILVG